MVKRPLSFMPTQDEIDFIESKEISWSAFCHKWIEKERGLVKEELIDKIGNRIIIILIGVMCMMFTFVISNLFVLIITTVCGAITVSIGTFSMLRVYRCHK